MSDTTDLMGVNAAPPESEGSGGTSSGRAPAEKGDAPATDASAAPASGAAPKRRRSGTGLEGMVLAELQQVASGLGIKGTGRMRKSQLIETIKERQAGGGSGADAPAARGGDKDAGEGEDQSAGRPKRRPTSRARTGESGAEGQQDSGQIDIPGQPANEEKPAGDRRGRREGGGKAEASADTAEGKTDGRGDGGQHSKGDGGGRGDRNDGRGDGGGRQQQDRPSKRDRQRGRGKGDGGGQNQNQGGGQNQGQGQGGGGRRDDDDFDGGRRGRRGRYRDRRGRRGGREDAEPQIAEDDVLIPVAGILDILDNYAFVRTSGYLPGPNDVYVSLAQVRKNGLRKGDHVTGAVRQPREGERREKFNALVRLDSVNGTSPEGGRSRAEFNKLTPLYPQERLRLETEPNQLTSRIIDLVSPI
ncbi:Rho termination factor N-terminal domain-containing protein, partial [Streptomyces sp. WMMB 322]|uniref:Rho termination factor N-terminal domain-containing protein n=1 Tax=Streptomyces sp. WMMB 322 TaxID=1286821 RepID=UPI0008239996